jgi:hypothetical protein
MKRKKGRKGGMKIIYSNKGRKGGRKEGKWWCGVAVVVAVVDG